MRWDYSKLLGKIREVFGTQDAFADAMGIGRTSLYARLNGTAEWKQNEMYKALELFHEPLSMLGVYFFALKVR